MSAQTTGVLHRPAVLWEPVSPSRQPPVAAKRRLDLHRGKSTVRRRIHRARGVHPLMGINPDDDHAALLRPSSLELKTADDTPTLKPPVLISPLLSQSTARHRLARQTLGQPAKWRHAVHESGQPAPLETLGQPAQIPSTHTSRRFRTSSRSGSASS